VTKVYKPDFYCRKAKEGGHVARSIFKLEELDEKFRLFPAGRKVLDLGASPGSWLEYVSEKVGDLGLAVGVDRNPLRQGLRPNMRFLKADVLEVEPARLREFAPFYDLVISDLAPSTTGDKDGDHLRSIELCERGRDLAFALLKQGGGFVCKMFQGGESKRFLTSLKPRFETVKTQKPKASRDESRELYVLALCFRKAK
jgi:23S rRNA (uridine2552-2'-O)-methyltransferase